MISLLTGGEKGSRWKHRTMGTLRVCSFLGVLWAGTALVQSATAQGGAVREEHLVRSGMRLTEQLAGLIDEPQELQVNGERVYVASSNVSAPVAEVLDELERYCHSKGGDLESVFGEIPDWAFPEDVSSEGKELVKNPNRWSTFRHDVPDGRAAPELGEGYVACLAHPDASSGLQGLGERFERFFESMDTGDLGDMRFFRAKWDEVGQFTHLIGVWTEGSLKLRNLFPEAQSTEDVHGWDPKTGPRPPESQRVFHVHATGTAYTMFSYDSKLTRAAVLDFYDREMGKAGWTLVTIGGERANLDPLDRYNRMYLRGGRAFVLQTAEPLSDKHKTGIDLLEMTRPATVEARVR